MDFLLPQKDAKPKMPTRQITWETKNNGGSDDRSINRLFNGGDASPILPLRRGSLDEGKVASQWIRQSSLNQLSLSSSKKDSTQTPPNRNESLDEITGLSRAIGNLAQAFVDDLDTAAQPKSSTNKVPSCSSFYTATSPNRSRLRKKSIIPRPNRSKESSARPLLSSPYTTSSHKSKMRRRERGTGLCHPIHGLHSYPKTTSRSTTSKTRNRCRYLSGSFPSLYSQSLETIREADSPIRTLESKQSLDFPSLLCPSHRSTSPINMIVAKIA